MIILCKKCLHWVRQEDHICRKFIVECDTVEDKEWWGSCFETVAHDVAQEANHCEDRMNEMVWDEPITITDDKGIRKRFNCEVERTIKYILVAVEDKKNG